MKSTSILRENGSDQLNVVTVGGLLVSPVHEHSGGSDNSRHVHHNVRLSDTSMSSRTENEPVFRISRVLVDSSWHPSIRDELLGIRVHSGVVERVPETRNEHSTGGNRVVVGERERLLDEVGDHDDGRSVSENLLGDGVDEGHLVEDVESDRSVEIGTTNSSLFLSDLGEDLRVVGEMLEGEGDGGRHGVLTGEDEGEQDEGHFVVGVLSEDEVGSFGGFVVCFSVGLGGENLLNPGVEQTIGDSSGGHSLLRVSSSGGEELDGDSSSSTGFPDFRSREGEGEVDEFESLSDEPVLVGNLLRVDFRDVASAEDSERSLHVEISEEHLVRLVIRVGVGHPFRKGCAVDAILHLEVDSERLSGEETIESLSVLVVDLSVQEDPVLGEKDLLGGTDEAGFSISRAVENLSRVIRRGGDDNEDVEYGDGRERFGP